MMVAGGRRRSVASAFMFVALTLAIGASDPYRSQSLPPTERRLDADVVAAHLEEALADRQDVDGVA
jgi:hypothetical protein